MKTKSNIVGKIELQRMKREHEAKQDPVKPKKYKKASSTKREDIADKVERQRNQRKKPKKKPTGAQGKDPKKIESRPFRHS